MKRASEAPDPSLSLKLLWGLNESSSRGPKPGLSVGEVVVAAVGIADTEGLAALSMRRVAERLGVGAMTLYTYVPGKRILLDLMFDRVVGEAVAGRAAEGGWRARLEAVARADWDLRHRHPWMRHIPWPRAPLGPNIADAFEASMAAVSGLGLSGQEMSEVVSLVGSYVSGAARNALEAAEVAVATGLTDTEWWAAVGPTLERVWDPTRFPTLSGPEMEGAWDQPEDDGRYFLAEARASFEFGLARILDGVESFIVRRPEAEAESSDG